MREIKFRAWQESGLVDDECDLRFWSWEEMTDMAEWGKMLNNPDYKIMQYTGIKDKNGKEIYEGDILSTNLSRPYLIVEYKNGAFMYQCHDEGKDYYDFMLPSYAESNHDYYSEVIGNIYENPELLTA